LYAEGQYDSETGLQYNEARYYSPEMGRWLSEDPLGFLPGDVDLYRYVGNDPTGGIDPSGLDVYLETYKGACNPGEGCSDSLCSPCNAYHQRIGVDTWDANGNFAGTVYFSFRSDGYRWPTFGSTWLGFTGVHQWGQYLDGVVYQDKSGGEYRVDKRKKTSKAQDAAELDRLRALENTHAAYSVLRLNCRAFSQYEFAGVEEQ
jgi:RHS repeat-associated protein